MNIKSCSYDYIGAIVSDLKGKYVLVVDYLHEICFEKSFIITLIAIANRYCWLQHSANMQEPIGRSIYSNDCSNYTR